MHFLWKSNNNVGGSNRLLFSSNLNIWSSSQIISLPHLHGPIITDVYSQEVVGDGPRALQAKNVPVLARQSTSGNGLFANSGRKTSPTCCSPTTHSEWRSGIHSGAVVGCPVVCLGGWIAKIVDKSFLSGNAFISTCSAGEPSLVSNELVKSGPVGVYSTDGV